MNQFDDELEEIEMEEPVYKTDKKSPAEYKFDIK